MEKEKLTNEEINNFASRIVDLKLLCDRLAEGEDSRIFTIKYQFLYLIKASGRIAPSELMVKLNMAKSNIAILAKKMINEGLINSIKDENNKKQIYYVLTELGNRDINSCLCAIEKNKTFTDEEIKIVNNAIKILKNK